MKQSGKIQSVWIATETTRERNQAIAFNGLFDFLKKLFRVYRSGCNKVIIFFDKAAIMLLTLALLSCSKEPIAEPKQPGCFRAYLISEKLTLDTLLIRKDTIWKEPCLQGRWVDTIRKEVGKVYWLTNCNPALGFDLEKRYYKLLNP